MKYIILLFLIACNSQEKPNPLIFIINNPSENKVVESVKPTVEPSEEIPVEIQTPVIISPYQNNYVYLFDSYNNIVYESKILNSQTIQGYQLQSDIMNAL